MAKTDIVFAILAGEGVAWLASGIVKGYGLEIRFLGLILAFLLPLMALAGLWVCYLLGKKHLFIFQAGKFLLVGVLATLVDLSVFKFLGTLFALSTGFAESCFKGTSFLVATFAKYWGNKFWAFEKKEMGGVGKEITQFYIVTLIGLAINVGAFFLVVSIIGPQFGTPPKIWETFGVLFAALVVAAWNFLGYKFIVFKK